MTKINTGGPAYPQDLVDGYTLDSMGMTKREVAAMAAMQGILAVDREQIRPFDVAHDAVAYADALIAKLGEGK
jgi:hypothetical protein